MANAQIGKIRALMRENPVIKPGATLAEMRQGLDAMGNMAPPLGDVSIEPVDAGGVDARWFVPDDGDTQRIVLYVHGGGYVLGSVQSHRILLERLAKACGCRVLALNYRLAPEAPFPAAVEDTVAAYRWLLKSGANANQIAIAGDSAGGGLALAALLALKDAGDTLPGCAVAISPWTDMQGTGASMLSRAAVDPIVHKAGLLELAATYLGEADPRSPLASPLHGDLGGLPPVLVQVGDCETLLDDSTRLEDKFKAAGVDATIEIWDDMIHVWHLFAPMLSKGQEAIERIGQYVRQHCV